MKLTLFEVGVCMSVRVCVREYVCVSLSSSVGEILDLWQQSNFISPFNKVAVSPEDHPLKSAKI